MILIAKLVELTNKLLASYGMKIHSWLLQESDAKHVAERIVVQKKMTDKATHW